MIKIEKLQSKDARVYRKITVQAISDVPKYSQKARESEQRHYSVQKIKQRLKNKSDFFLVAKKDNKVIGVVCGFLYAGVAWIEWIGIERRTRRLGLAKKLLRALEKELRNKKIHKIWANIDVKNIASRQLFIKSGYRLVGRVKKHWYRLDSILVDKLI